MNFCGNCGQKAYKKIDKFYIKEELQYTLIHTNKGFLYSIKKIVQNPGKTAREFVDGNRVQHYKPIALLFILSSISSFMLFKIIKMNEMMSSYYANQKLVSPMMLDYNTALSSYNNFLMLIMVPVFALCSWLVLKKWGHNYYEHVVMNAYVLCASTILAIFVTNPIMYFFKDNSDVFMTISGLSMVTMVLIYFWFFKGFYPEKSTKQIFLNLLLITLLIVVAYFTLIFMVMIIHIIWYAIAHGGEAMMRYVKPTGT
jgi:hypothetical protein